MQTRIFSGIRPSGKLHLGNYLGAIKNWVALQDKADEAVFAVVDLHGITTPYDQRTYHRQVTETAIDFLAAGIDPDKTLLIRQSQVPQHTELAWLFSTITPVSWIDRLPTYKEQLEKSPKYNHVGLRDYPILMAADILLYKSNLVPVGEDQLPHIDLTNEIVKKFNTLFGETFEPVKPYIAEGARIMSLQDPYKKMSKTPHQANPLTAKNGGGLGAGQAVDDQCIFLSDTPDVIRAKIKKAVTDSGAEIKYDERNKPAISNLLTIYHLMTGRSVAELEKEYAGKTYVQFKNDLAEAVITSLAPIQKRYRELAVDPAAVTAILQKCEEHAKIIAGTNLAQIRQRMGL